MVFFFCGFLEIFLRKKIDADEERIDADGKKKEEGNALFKAGNCSILNHVILFKQMIYFRFLLYKLSVMTFV
jgi:hypothetical protein